MLRFVPAFVAVFSFAWTSITAAADPAAGQTVVASKVTPADKISLPEGFSIELVYEVPADGEASQGSWVSLAVDPQGRLIASDQYGGMYRIDPSADPATVEPITAQYKGEVFGGAQGLLCAFDALYAAVNDRDRDCGVFRLTDTDGDDAYDKVERILEENGGSEHGPHALILSPDGKRIFHVAGNNTNLPPLDHSRVPQVWDEDQLLPRMPDARGHNANRMAPGGYILSMDPDGKNTELVATGFRNPYDIAFDKRGELFTYDADMEWDVGTPWYRPTRINHVISGAEFGWRNGTGKWPEDYPDSFGAAVNIGPGSPTGICFGYQTKFPKRFQNALFISDWSYGNLHAVHLTPDGATYTGTYETFATAAPLPITDLVVHPTEGVIYMTVGGRRTQSGLYRLRYTGNESTDAIQQPVKLSHQNSADVLLSARRNIERFHRPPAAESPIGDEERAMIDGALSSPDRAIRFAARIALEHMGAEAVRGAAADAKTADGKIGSVIAMARVGVMDRIDAIETLDSIDWEKLDSRQKIDLLRAYGLVAIRMGGIPDEQRQNLVTKFQGRFPSGQERLDRELASWLVYLEDETATAKIVERLTQSGSQESQIHYAMVLRGMSKGWTDDLRRQYFSWFRRIASARGGMSFGGFVANIKSEAVANLSDDQKSSLADVLSEDVESETTTSAPRELVQQWTITDLESALASVNSAPKFDVGKQVFADAQCYKCHRMGIEGGILGPDLTSAGGKYGVHDLITHILDPSKEVSDQYAAASFLTDDGRLIVGRIINMNGGNYSVMTNMLDPSDLTDVAVDSIEETRMSPTSMMPSGLLDTFTADQIADLIVYLRAGGNQNHRMYSEPVAATSP